ncbi:polyphosphate polymerase domain-containing protein [bacterium]|nr:polyphosphate polymerase domain-containing protein [bacterium]
MSQDLSKIRRYELKYTVTEAVAAAIIDYIKGFCSLDEHVPAGEKGYIVNNLYFDTPELRFYYDTKFRRLTRYKPRARYYGETIGDYIWPELKFRNSSVIWKIRHKAPVSQWHTLFHPQYSNRTEPLIKERLDTFEEVVHWHGAQPIMHVRYFRVPFVTQIEDYGRVTFDRSLSYRMANGSFDPSCKESDMIYYDDAVTTMHCESPVLLEIKVERLVPFWAIDLIKRFELVQRPFSKYCYGIDNNMAHSPDMRHSILRSTM